MLRLVFRGCAVALVAIVFGSAGWAFAQDGPAASQPALEDVGPTLVTLKLASPEPGAVFNALMGQAKLEVDGPTKLLLDQDHNHLPDVDIERKPFWEALSALSETSPYVFHGINSDGTVSLSQVPMGVSRPPSLVSGPFMVTISRIDVNLRKSVEFVGRAAMNAGNNSYAAPPCLIYMYVNAEPRVKPVVWFVDSIDKCETDNGKELEPMHFGMGPVASGQVNSLNDIQLRFNTAPEGARSIATLRMSTRFIVERERKTLMVENILNKGKATYEVGGFHVEFQGLNHTAGEQYAYTITVRREGQDARTWQRFQALLGRFGPKFVDSNGHPLQGMGGSGRYSPDELSNSNSMRGSAGEAGGPVKMVWDFPARVEEVSVPVEFRNVALP
jgi:hypothetical protein